MKNIEEVVRQGCHEKKWTLREFCKRLEMEEPSIQKIFRKNSTTIQTLEKMAEVLEISVGDFFENPKKLEEAPAGYTVISNQELIDLQRLALGNMKKELEQSKNNQVVPK
jgi:transcriptional regulator with XRE-family HTH domain